MNNKQEIAALKNDLVVANDIIADRRNEIYKLGKELVVVDMEVKKASDTAFNQSQEIHKLNNDMHFRDKRIRDLMAQHDEDKGTSFNQNEKLKLNAITIEQLKKDLNEFKKDLNRAREFASTLVPKNSSQDKQVAEANSIEPQNRQRLPHTRQSITHKFSISGHEGYLTVGTFEDGRPGELFIRMAKEGSTIGGLMDSIGILTSLLLQYGVEVSKLREKFAHTRFEPSGHTKCTEIGEASSVVDYIFRWLDLTFSKEN